jgi:hypothetical protein
MCCASGGILVRKDHVDDLIFGGDGILSYAFHEAESNGPFGPGYTIGCGEWEWEGLSPVAAMARINERIQELEKMRDCLVNDSEKRKGTI